MRIVVALGGNALIQRGQPLTVKTQRDNLANAVSGLVALAREHQVLITHGNGPQVGLLALQADAYAQTQPVPSDSGTPLDVLGAQSEGMVGYLIEAALTTAFASALPQQRVATLLTLVEVAATDPAFSNPSKPIGPLYSQTQMRHLARSTGWHFARDAGPANPGGVAAGHEADAWRRVVPSPAPQRVLEMDVLRLLLAQGVTVICGGGGGIPVIKINGAWVGTEAVIDKDLSSSLIAHELQADVLLLLTDVPGVARNFSEMKPQWLRHTSPETLATLKLPAGSMGPKVQAAMQFVQSGDGRRAAIGRLEDALALAQGHVGTQLTASGMAQLREIR
jgi:carbamate kinase